jgi:rhamnopyranosyl-N-acetylglucosaminyl-diphospho-decaprenol beta-1,3/1,4-galactofuranosyltransferase
MEKAIAVVVTYNRLTLLKECITALRNQTKIPDAILVVNNGSTDDTGKWLLTQPDLLSITQTNVGSAGGFETGITWAYKNGYSWIWCMDDDGYPKEDALEKILAPELDRLCLRNCAVLNKADKTSFVWKTKNYTSINDVDCEIINGIGHPFNGTMIHRNIVERVGAPKQKFFLWGDETEYYYRITKKNRIPVCTIAGSIHYHPAAAFSCKKDWDYLNTWKMYFYVRNRLHIHRAKFSNRLLAWANYSCFLLGLAGIILVYQKTDKVKKLNFLLWPVMDALKNDFSANPSLILTRLSSTEANTKTITGLNIRNSMLSIGNLFTPLRLRRA